MRHDQGVRHGRRVLQGIFWALFVLMPGVVWAQADLVMSSWRLSTTNATGAGSRIAITYNIRNAGNRNAGAFEVGFYYHDTSTFSTTTRIGSASITGLTAGQSTGNRTLNVTLPKNVLFGARYIHYYIDYNRKVAERSEFNNISGTRTRPAQQITITGLPDLRITDLVVTPTTQTRSGTLTAYFRIYNYGYSRTSGAFNTRLYYSENNTYQTSDPYLGVQATTTPHLNARTYWPATGYYTATVKVPTSATNGTRYILGYVDYNNRIPNEISNNNNVYARSFTVVAAKPELSMKAWSAPSIATGYPATVTVTYNVQNTGSANAGSFDVAFYYGDTTSTTGLTYINRATISALNARAETGNRTISLRLPPNVRFGARYLHYYIDYRNQVSEMDDTAASNRGHRRLTITGLPNYQVYALNRTPSSQIPGGDLTLQVYVRNAGASRATTTSTVRFYFSVNNTLGAGDIPLTGTLTTPALFAGQSNYQTLVVKLPTTITGTGTRYIIAQADATNRINEGNTGERDNTRAVAFTLTRAIPDLLMSTWSATTSALGYKSNVTISYTIRNAGNANAGAFRVSFYYGDSSTNTGLTLLKSIDLTGLTARNTVTGSTTVTLPANVLNGTRYLHYFIDSLNRVAEATETNNRGYRTIRITGSPNLQVSILSVNPSSQVKGGQLTVTYRVVNVGQTRTNTYSYLGLYYSADSTITTTDTLLRSIYAGVLNAGSSYPSTGNATTLITLPLSATAGTRYIGAIADYSRRVAESSETDNVKAASFTVITSIPDLVMESWSATPTSTAGAGDTITITFKLKNSGNQNAGAFKVAFYYGDSFSTTNLTPLGTPVSITSLNAGASTATLRLAVKLPANVVWGTRYLHYFIDSERKISEANETNNRGRRTISITGRPNLQVSILSLDPTSQIRSGQIKVTYRITNVGKSRTTSSSYVGFYFSTNATITTSDTYRTRANVGVLNAGASYPAAGNGTTYVYVPTTATIGSTAYIGAIADYLRAITESNETDNTKAASFRVLASIPELYMNNWSITPRTVSSASAKLTISFRLRNSGNANAGAFKVTFYYGNTATTTKLTAIGSYSSPGLQQLTLDTTRTLQVSLPANALSGTRYIHYFIDSEQKISERYETNNRSWLLITISGPPDLNPTRVVATPIVQQAGKSVKVDYTIFNRGAKDVGTFRVGIYFSKDAVIQTTDTLLHSFTIASLKSNTSTSGSRTFTLPMSIPGGKGFIGLFVDDNAKITEFSEANNTISTAFETLVDKDKDGVPNNVDCDDNDKDRYPAYNGKPANKETCDGKDNDCNNQVDDGITCNCTNGSSRDCYSGTAGTDGKGICKKGKQTCANGQWGTCVGEVTPQSEDCNGKDDDCNGKIDDNLTKKCYTGAAGTAGVGECVEGTQACVNGTWDTCQGEVTPQTEICDGKDNNCDGQIDNAAACQEKPKEGGSTEKIITDAGITDAGTTDTQPELPADADCYVTGCPTGEICKAGQCVTDPCDGITCNADEFCRDGACIKACGCTQCATNQRCIDGQCQTDPCAGITCNQGEICDPTNSQCKTDPCNGVTCGKGRICKDGACEDDPCNHIQCPQDMECKKGQCVGLQCNNEPSSELTGEVSSEPTTDTSNQDTNTDAGNQDTSTADQPLTDTTNQDTSQTDNVTGQDTTSNDQSTPTDQGQTTDQGKTTDGVNSQDTSQTDNPSTQDIIIGGDGSGNGDGTAPPPGGCCQTGSAPHLPLVMLVLLGLFALTRRHSHSR